MPLTASSLGDRARTICDREIRLRLTWNNTGEDAADRLYLPEARFHERSFNNKPLDPTLASIRLTEVLPTSSDGIVECQVRHTTTASHYTCLSYVRRVSADMETMCTASSASASASNVSLSDVKQDFDFDKSTNPLWIDTSCIWLQ
jgi:hypothetical protein